MQREAFGVDLTAARANGTVWDLSLENDRIELRGLQNREQPELLAGSPPSGHLFLLRTCVKPEELSAMKTERIEPHMTTCVAAFQDADGDAKGFHP